MIRTRRIETVVLTVYWHIRFYTWAAPGLERLQRVSLGDVDVRSSEVGALAELMEGRWQEFEAGRKTMTQVHYSQ